MKLLFASVDYAGLGLALAAQRAGAVRIVGITYFGAECDCPFEVQYFNLTDPWGDQWQESTSKCDSS